MPCADDVVKVKVAEVWDANIGVPFLITEVQYVRQALDTFIAYPRQVELNMIICSKAFLYC